MTKEKNPMEIIFAPGCFDDFEGTQEELDELIKEITQSFESGEAFEKATTISVDDMMQELSDEELDELFSRVKDIPRSLQ